MVTTYELREDTTYELREEVSVYVVLEVDDELLLPEKMFVAT